MEILHYALGIRFDTRKFPCGDFMYHAFSMLCSVLSYTELNGIKIHGGFPYDNEPDTYLVVLENEHYKPLRRIFTLLNQDNGLKLFLTDEMPFIDKNRLLPIQGLVPYGSYDYIYCKLANAPKSIYNIQPSKTRAIMDGKHYNFLFAPDSFKGTISSEDAIRLLTLAARETHYRGCNILPIPIADGGEGTLNAILKCMGGEIISTTVHNPLGEPIQARYGIINNNNAIIEMAEASGITLLAKDELNPMKASSYGTGELILHAINSGYRNVTVALGGSATNDGGMGCANALGIRFLDSQGNELTPNGENMVLVNSIDTSYVPAEVRETKFTILCDVDNPLTGHNGATAVFAPQKGAKQGDIPALEMGMKNLRRHYNNMVGYNICDTNGAGAAGGMGAMLMAMFKATKKQGIDTILDLASFDNMLSNVSLIVTGEGCLDEQTFTGNKAVAGIIKRTKSRVPIAIICGKTTSSSDINEMCSSGFIPLTHSFVDEETATSKAKELFYSAAVNMFNLLKSGSNMKKRVNK